MFSLKGYKHGIFCVLQFISSTTATIGLCCSVYDLSHTMDQPWVWTNYTVSGCIITTIIVNSLKDAITSNPKIFLSEEELRNYPSPNV